MLFLLFMMTFVVSLVTTLLVARFFDATISLTLKRIIGGELAPAWSRYLRFVLVVVGLSGGVKTWSIERYLVVPGKGRECT